MATIEQCNHCGRGLGSCPYFNQEEVNPCLYFLKPIDNSGFFSHFLSAKGRIGRLQYSVTILLALVIWPALFFAVDTIVKPSTPQITSLILLLCTIPTAALVVLASIKRSHDFSEDGSYAITGTFKLYCKGSDEGLNAFGTEPLKPYEEQVNWQQKA